MEAEVFRILFATFLSVGLIGVSGFYFFKGEYLSACAFLAGACAVLVPSIMGRGAGNWDSASAAMDFVTNPAGAIVDAAVDRIGGAVEERTGARTEKEEPGFDADAAFKRYMERKADAGGGPPEAVSPPLRTFGRKGGNGA